MPGATLWPAGPDDLEHVKWALYTAVTWDPARPVLPFSAAIEHPQLVIYHRGWVREGDFGVIAEQEGRVVGVAFCRVFTDGEHGHGYVDPETPEIAIAVAEGHRGAGLGARLLEALAGEAHRAGLRHLSLSVDRENPARRLYERAGYRVASDDESGVRIVLDL
jgi:GNAT superfamily N-acetyltransferase